MDIDLIVILFIWGIVIPFIGIKLVFFGGFQPKQKIEMEDEDFYWENKNQKSKPVDMLIGFAFLVSFIIFLYLIFNGSLLSLLVSSLRF